MKRLFIVLGIVTCLSEALICQGSMKGEGDAFSGVYSALVSKRKGKSLVRLYLSKTPIYNLKGEFDFYRVMGAFARYDNKKGKGTPYVEYFTHMLNPRVKKKINVSADRLRRTNDKLSKIGSMNIRMELSETGSIDVSGSGISGTYSKIADSDKSLENMVKRISLYLVSEKVKRGNVILGSLSRSNGRQYGAKTIHIELPFSNPDEIWGAERLKVSYSTNGGTLPDYMAEYLITLSFNNERVIHYLPELEQLEFVEKSSLESHFLVDVKRSSKAIRYNVKATNAARLRDQRVTEERERLEKEKADAAHRAAAKRLSEYKAKWPEAEKMYRFLEDHRASGWGISEIIEALIYGRFEVIKTIRDNGIFTEMIHNLYFERSSGYFNGQFDKNHVVLSFNLNQKFITKNGYGQTIDRSTYNTEYNIAMESRFAERFEEYLNADHFRNGLPNGPQSNARGVIDGMLKEAGELNSPLLVQFRENLFRYTEGLPALLWKK